MKKSLLFQILIILCVTAASGLLYNAFSSQGISLIYQSLEVKVGSHLTGDQTYRLLREGQTLFIDSRYKLDFLISHIPGSLNIPSNLARDELMKALDPIPKEKLIVVYCKGQTCQSARRLAGLMTYLGFERVHVYLAGFEEWLEKRYPIEKL